MWEKYEFTILMPCRDEERTVGECARSYNLNKTGRIPVKCRNTCCGSFYELFVGRYDACGNHIRFC